MELKKERVIHTAGEVFGRDHGVAENERGDPAICICCNTHSYFRAQRMSENGGAARDYLLQKCGDILRVVRDAVAARNAAGCAMAAQIEREYVEARRKFRQQNEKRSPVSRPTMQEDEDRSVLRAFGVVNGYGWSLKILLFESSGVRFSDCCFRH